MAEDNVNGPSDQERITPYLKQIKSDAEIKTKKDLNYEENRRSGTYSEILQNYQNYINKALIAKICFKWITFIVVIIILTFISVSTMIIFIKCISLNMEIVDWISIAIPTLTSFLSSFIILPKIITEYLFSKDEETNMRDFIKLVMEYDSQKHK